MPQFILSRSDRSTLTTSFDLPPEQYKLLCQKHPRRGEKAKVLRALVKIYLSGQSAYLNSLVAAELPSSPNGTNGASGDELSACANCGGAVLGICKTCKLPFCEAHKSDVDPHY